MSDIYKIPNSVESDVSVGGASVYGDTGVNYDYAIAGLPFYSAASKDNPMVRKTAPYRKPPNDNSSEPGEQSLAFWWIKAQSSFHGGAGQLYIDTPVPQGAEIRPVRFQTSAGVDPWTQGKLSLLPTTAKAASITSSSTVLKSVVDSAGNAYLLYSDGTGLWRVQETVTAGVPSYTTPTAVAWGGTGVIQSLVTDGRLYYVTDGTGVWRGDFTSPATAATKIYNMTAGTAVLVWVKQRLMLGYTATGVSSAVYELNNNAGSGTALPAAKFTHPNLGWIWTSFAEGPSAIYASGYSGQSSEIYKFVLSSDGSTPTLTTGITVAQFPPGEIVYAIYGYLNAMIGIQTTRGFRIGQFNSQSASGEFQYGPVSVAMTATTGAIVGSDRFMFCAYTDSSGVAGLARVDLSQQLSIRPFSYVPDQRFAFAADLRATDNSEAFVNGKTAAVDMINGRLAFVVPTQGLFVQHPSFLTPTGTMTTSRIRYETLDPKIVRYVRLRAEGSAGQLSVSVNSNADSGGANALVMDISQSQDSGDIGVSLQPTQFVTATFTLTRDSVVKSNGPAMLGYQIKSLPAQKRQRFIQLPLQCYDFERDNVGQRTGGDGTALSRLQALEALEEAGDLVSVQALGAYADQQYTQLGVIEDVQFQQTSSPTDKQGWGGVVTVTLRTVG